MCIEVCPKHKDRCLAAGHINDTRRNREHYHYIGESMKACRWKTPIKKSSNREETD